MYSSQGVDLHAVEAGVCTAANITHRDIHPIDTTQWNEVASNLASKVY
jgi:hypothetical protein